MATHLATKKPGFSGSTFEFCSFALHQRSKYLRLILLYKKQQENEQIDFNYWRWPRNQ